MSECCNENSSGRCRLAVTVEDDFSPCNLTPKLFDVEIHTREGDTVASGKVAGGSSAVFSLPSAGEYSVTVTGGICSSPRAQTRRVSCCCGMPNGVTFIFMSAEHNCPKPPKPPKPPCCMPPVPRPPKPPCCQPLKPQQTFPGEGLVPCDVTIIEP